MNDCIPGQSPAQATHRKRLQAIRDDAMSVSGTTLKIAQAINQLLENGGILNAQPQIAFLTGAYARILKDIGVIEHLQSQGVIQKKPMARAK